MNEEEKKSVNELKEEINKPVEVQGDKFNTFILYNIESAKTILNLIEKLQKENEELKFEERRRIIGKYGDAEIHDVINRTLSNDYIPVQKVKDKIEEIKRL